MADTARADDEAGEPVWAVAAAEVVRRLGTSTDGLSEAEAAVRLARHGPNELPEPRRLPLWRRLLSQFTHFLALLLWAAGGLAFLAGTPELGWAVWAVVVINGGFSFWQEYRAERALAELKRMLPERVRVVREGVVRLLSARELVPGDVVLLEEGDRVSADGRLIWSDGLLVDASLLTGESLPVAREAETVAEAARRPADAPNLVLAGTTVVAGRGLAVVFATGAATVFGRVAHLTAAVERGPSTLERRLRSLVRVITMVAGGAGLAILGLGMGTGLGARQSFLMALGIVVALVPEGLLPMITLSLALGVQSMARRRALVRRLSAVETLSAVSVICTDKTGTLTENELTVRFLWVPPPADDAGAEDGQGWRGRLPGMGRLVQVTGSGYDPSGRVRLPEEAEVCRQVRLLLAGAALCSNARLAPVEESAGSRTQVEPGRGAGGWRAVGDPTEAALLVAARKAGLDADELARAAPRVREFPFDPWRKRMTVVLRGDGGLWPGGAAFLAVTKGAPVELLARCTCVLRGDRVEPLSEAARRTAVAANDTLAEEGLRVLAVALRPGGEELLTVDRETLEGDLVLVGLAAMEDPPRPGVEEAVRVCRAAGIRVTMVTGDYGVTAEALARRIGLAEDGGLRVVAGAELDALPDAGLLDLLHREGASLVFARTTPEQKLRLVQAYRRLGHVVAVTGDGINDAPALHAAHVGIAMGRSGTDVAREAADVVLADDDFATIVAAVEQGRAVYHNIRKFMSYILASNVAEVMPFLAMAALRVPPALNILQILSVDLGSDLVPALALGAEPPEPGLMHRPPREETRPLLDRPLLTRACGFLGLIEGAAGLAAFFGFWLARGVGPAELQRLAPALLAGTAPPGLMDLYRHATTLTLAAIVACQAGNVFACRSERESVLRLGFLTNRLVWVGLAVEAAVVGAVVYLPPFARVFLTVPLPAPHWLYLLAGPVILLLAEEARKAVVRAAARRGG